MKILIIAGSNFSEYSQGLIEISEKMGFEVSGVLIRRTFSLDRLVEEFSRKKWNIFFKIITKVYNILGFSFIRKTGWAIFFEKNNIKKTKLTNLCKRKGIKYYIVNSFKDKESSAFVEALKADIALFGGGGIIRQNLLDLLPIINCHMGVLPDYRGSYPWVWAILNNEINKIGISVHLMDNEIDSGLILHSKLIDIKLYKNIYEVETALEFIMIDEMFLGLNNFMNLSSLNLINNNNFKKIEGIIYFTPHSKLFNFAKNNFIKIQKSGNL